jgi:signal transduction histidine kinase
MRWVHRRASLDELEELAELRRARDDLATRQTYLDTLMDTVQVAIVACDAEGRIVHQNAHSRELTGRPLIGALVTELAGDLHDIRFTEPDGLTPISVEKSPLHRALREDDVPDAEMLLHSPGERPRTLLVHSRALRATDGSLRGAVAAGHDITGLRDREAALARANARLADANQLKVDLMATLSHEINQPLFAITGYTDLLLQDWDDLDEDRRRTYVERLDTAGRTLRQLVADLLLMFRVEAGALTPNRAVVRLADVLSESLTLLSGAADVRVHAAPLPGDSGEPGVLEPPAAFADPSHLRQMLVNLVNNAVKYGAPPIDVHLHGPPADAPRARHSLPPAEGWHRRVRITVRDHGPGIPDEFVPRLFDRFTRATTTKPGSGLGLFIVRQLVEANGGSVTYQHAHPHGATFTIDLPAAAAPATTHPSGDHWG